MRLRLFLAFTLVIFVALSAVFIFVQVNTEKEVTNYWSRGALIGAEELVLELEEYYSLNSSWAGAETLMISAGQGKGTGQGQGASQGRGVKSHFRLADVQGTIVYDPQDQTAGTKVSQAELDKGVTLLVNSKPVGYLLPLLGEEFPGQGLETELIARVNGALFTAALVSGVIALLLSVGLAYGILRPVRNLTQAASQMAEGDLSVRVDKKGSAELLTLGNVFNHMALSLEEAEQNRRAMTADIAHELRTPLAVQRANLEAMQDGVYELNPENLSKILDQNRLLTRLVADLRTLSLADAGELKLEKSKTDLASLVKRVAERFEMQAGQKGIGIEISVPPAGRIFNLDAQRVEQIIHNLLQNALRYTPAGSKVSVSLEYQGTAALIRVHDSGPGVPQESLPYIFERFYRADRSRSREEGGTGLGLPIARRLAEAHGGTLQAENDPQGGAVFTLTLPGM